MILMLTIVPAAVKTFASKLLEIDANFEFNNSHGKFRIHNVKQLMLMTDSDCFAATVNNKFQDKFIHKGNIAEICISEEDAKSS